MYSHVFNSTSTFFGSFQCAQNCELGIENTLKLVDSGDKTFQQKLSVLLFLWREKQDGFVANTH